MGFVTIEKRDTVAVATMQRGKVNAFESAAVDDMAVSFEKLARDDSVGAVVLTGNGKFFSFGFDVPELLTYDRETLHDYLTRFTQLMTMLYLFPRPLVAAINGHTTAGGCMLATIADYRVMAAEGARISLNEINIGVPVFAGPTAILAAVVGRRNAEVVLNIGRMYTPNEALTIGLVDTLVPADSVLETAVRVAAEYAERNRAAFAQTKRLLREPVAAGYAPLETKSIDEFVEIWFSEQTQAQLRTVEIRK